VSGFRLEERSTAIGIFNSGAAIGAMIAPPLIVWLGSSMDGGRPLLSLGYWVIYGSRSSGLPTIHPNAR